MAQALQTTVVTAEIAVLVPRGTDCDLPEATEKMLADIDAVRGVERVDHTGFRPRSTDIAVEATVRLSVDAPAGRGAIADVLVDGFGVRAATVTEMKDR